MDAEYIGGLILSILFFAPGLVILTVAALFGVLMLVEKAIARSAQKTALEQAVGKATLAAETANPPAGPIVSGLQDTVEPKRRADERNSAC